ncbi:hypothetical protein PsorP6_019243 [Peronosclerospora sorghi]|nr:hypothetical protein PsorP6_019243 [Peronosclerospora sorghi]
MHSTKEIAAALQQEQLYLWLASEKNVDEVFISLKLKNEGHKMFESTKMETLNMYMEKFNAKGKKPDEKLVTMFGVLLHAFGESNLAFLLLAAVTGLILLQAYTVLCEEARNTGGLGLFDDNLSYTIGLSIVKYLALKY